MERINVMVCAGTGCTSSNSAGLVDKFNELLPKYGLEKEVKVITSVRIATSFLSALA